MARRRTAPCTPLDGRSERCAYNGNPTPAVIGIDPSDQSYSARFLPVIHPCCGLPRRNYRASNLSAFALAYDPSKLESLHCGTTGKCRAPEGEPTIAPWGMSDGRPRLGRVTFSTDEARPLGGMNPAWSRSFQPGSGRSPKHRGHARSRRACPVCLRRSCSRGGCSCKLAGEKHALSYRCARF